MKSILISIRPEWVAKILNEEKTVEIRKTAPKCELPITVYIYCTKSKDFLLDKDQNFFVWDKHEHHYLYEYEEEPKEHYFQGKVVASFTLRNVHRFDWRLVVNPFFKVRGSCLGYNQLVKYAIDTKGPVHDLYGWYISDLVIFDEPKKLSEFYTLKCSQKKRPCNIKDVFGLEECHRICKLCKPLTKAPESWCYVEEIK